MKYAALILLLAASTAVAGPKLYVFDCGMIYLDDVDMFNLTNEETSVRELFVPCYLVEHEQGLMLWDGGLPLEYAEADGPIARDGGSSNYETSIVDQLAAMGITPADIDYAAFSHLHWDHAGTANTWVQSEVIMQKAEWESATGPGGAFVETQYFDQLTEPGLRMIEGDHDVFGDGQVRIIFSPGHTPGHQALLVNLENYGPVLLSGDLYHFRANRTLRRPPKFNVDAAMTLESMDKVEAVIKDTGATLWIEHDKALADTLKKTPAFYD